MTETRYAPRYRVSKPAMIGSGKNAIACVIRNLSTTGAAIEVENQINIPDSFVMFVSEDDLRLLCHVVWRKDYRIGVAFDWESPMPVD
ncbi:MAG: PilZ domain-containing protein [Afipia felis]|nr:PilZ domain-containing protein [Afipia felis]